MVIRKQCPITTVKNLASISRRSWQHGLRAATTYARLTTVLLQILEALLLFNGDKKK